MNGRVSFFWVSFVVCKLLESSRQSGSKAELDPWVIGEKMFESYEKVDDEVFFFGVLKTRVLEERFNDWFCDFFRAEDISSYSAQNNSADGPTHSVSDFQFIVEEECLETSKGLFAHFWQALISWQEKT